MCAHYESVIQPERLRMHFGVELPAGVKGDIWPGYLAPFIRRHPHLDVDDEAVQARKAVGGLYGQVPHWATDQPLHRTPKLQGPTETFVEKPSVLDAPHSWSASCRLSPMCQI